MGARASGVCRTVRLSCASLLPQEHVGTASQVERKEFSWLALPMCGPSLKRLPYGPYLASERSVMADMGKHTGSC